MFSFIVTIYCDKYLIFIYWYSIGLISSSRTDKLAHHKQPYAHVLDATNPNIITVATSSDLFHAVQYLKPSALIGVSAQGQSFTEAICKEMAKNNEHPLILGIWWI